MRRIGWVAAVGVLLVAGCSGSKRDSADPVASAGAGVGSRASSSPSPAPVVSKHLPDGFQAVAVDALPTKHLWNVLGADSLQQTSDGGKHWITRAVPQGFAQNCQSEKDPCPRADVGLAFIDTSHGLLWNGGKAWTTTDSGDSWQVAADLGGDVVDSARTAGGVVFLALAQACTNPPQGTAAVCTNALAKYSKDGLSTTALPEHGDEPVKSLTYSDLTERLTVLLNGGASGHVLTSGDDGATFTTVKSQSCVSTSIRWASHTLWSVCSSGNAARLLRSGDAGKSFTEVSLSRQIPNSARVLPSTDQCGLLLIPGAVIQLCGQTEAQLPGTPISAVPTSTDGYLALLSKTGGSETLLAASADAGKSWKTL